MVTHIVVGVDGSPGSQATLDFAVAQAALRGSSGQALHSWQCPVADSDSGWVVPLAEYESYARRVRDDAVAKAAPSDGHGSTIPPVVADLQQYPAKRLPAAAPGADLLVVGSCGHGGFVGVLLGSVSHHSITHASCPVVVVPEPGEPRSETTS